MVSRQFVFFFVFSRNDFTHTQKAQKAQKHKTQISNFHSDVFYMHKKLKKLKNANKQLSLRCFLCTYKAQNTQKA